MTDGTTPTDIRRFLETVHPYDALGDAELDRTAAAFALRRLNAGDLVYGIGEALAGLYLIADGDGQIIETHSGSAGLDYPGVGPEHAWLKDSGRANYVGITDDEALAAFHQLAKTEGILAALESAHAVAYGVKLAATLPRDQHVLVNLSGRGDKDVNTIARLEGISL